MRRKRDIYAVIAALLPVALGFGLIDLYVTGRIGALAAILSALGLAAVMFVIAILADFESDVRRGTRGNRLFKDRP
jgi:hypothetical protein